VNSVVHTGLVIEKAGEFTILRAHRETRSWRFGGTPFKVRLPEKKCVDSA
jgi:hypothetical protein